MREDAAPIFRKVGVRIIPLLFVCYLFNYIDRVNVGFAKLQMLGDLGMSETVYGLGAGIFFLGYLVFGIPSNLALQRVGARRWIAFIMVAWGLLSMAMMFVRGPASFYTLRFLTGVAEAGFFPGMVLYLTQWFPYERHGRAMAVFMTAIPISGVVGGPVSGMMLDYFSDSQHGLLAWQWLFLLQGLPTVLLGCAIWFVLSDGYADARWLSAAEKGTLRDIMAENERRRPATAADSFAAVVRNPSIWMLGVLYFCILSGLYAISFWLPSIIEASGETDVFMIGMLSAVPYLAAVVFMVLAGRSADHRRERRWHLIVALAIGAAGLMVAAAAHDPWLSLAGMTLATMGAVSCVPLFWPLTNSYLSAAAAAGGLALINSSGNIAGFLSPFLVGWIKDLTGSAQVALQVLAALLFLAIFLVLRTPARTASS